MVCLLSEELACRTFKSDINTTATITPPLKRTPPKTLFQSKQLEKPQPGSVSITKLDKPLITVTIDHQKRIVNIPEKILTTPKIAQANEEEEHKQLKKPSIILADNWCYKYAVIETDNGKLYAILILGISILIYLFTFTYRKK